MRAYGSTFVFLRAGSFFLNKAALRFSEVFPRRRRRVRELLNRFFLFGKFERSSSFLFRILVVLPYFFVAIWAWAGVVSSSSSFRLSLLIISGSGYFLIIYPPPFLFEKFHHGEL